MNPVLGSHLDSQFAFFNDLSQSLAGSFQSICAANLKLSQTMLEDTLGTAQRMLATTSAGDMLGAATAGAQPAADKLRCYQQHLSRLAADAQVELSRVTQEHGPETARTAQALADEVTRVASEESERNLRQKEAFVKNFRDPFQQDGAGQPDAGSRAKAGAQGVRAAAEASMQAAGEALFRGNAQGQATGSAQQPGFKPSVNNESGATR